MFFQRYNVKCTATFFSGHSVLFTCEVASAAGCCIRCLVCPSIVTRSIHFTPCELTLSSRWAGMSFNPILSHSQLFIPISIPDFRFSLVFSRIVCHTMRVMARRVRPAVLPNDFITGVHSSVSDCVARKTADRRRRRRRGATNCWLTARDVYYSCWRSAGSQCSFLAVWFSSSVKLQYAGRRTISGKLLAIGFAATMRLLSNYFDLLFLFLYPSTLYYVRQGTFVRNFSTLWVWLSLIHIWRCRRIERCRSRWSPYH